METERSSLPRLKDPEFFPEFWKTIFSGVFAFIDVRSGSDNRSKGIATQMEKMGATILLHYSKKVTHVIFKDGSKPIYDKAKAAGIPIVSYLWVVSCIEKGEIVPTAGHEAINSQDYDSPFFKWRKVKSMQPKGLEEELILAERLLERRRKKARQSLPISDQGPSKEALPLRTPITQRKPIIDRLIESSPLVQERIHQQLASGKTCDDVFTVDETEEQDFDTFFNTPLMIKIISKNYYSPLDPTPSSVRKILSEVRQSSLATSTTPTLSSHSKNGENSTRKTPSTETIRVPVSVPRLPLAQSGSKRKTCSSITSVAKKRKENDEDISEKLPRRKLLFQPKRVAQLPQDPVLALTPEESPKKLKIKHPCFSQVVQRERCDELILPIAKSPRRDSLADFRIPKKRTLRKPTLVCTSLNSESLKMAEKAVERLREYELIDNVNDTTTHVICGDLRRTMNVLRGIVRGTKIVSFHWVTESMAKGEWLNEDKYPVERFSAAASLYRANKLLLFENNSLYVSSMSKVPKNDLCDLIECVGGKLTNILKRASIIVGQHKPQVDVPCVTSNWILDSIEKGVTLPLTNYIISSA